MCARRLFFLNNAHKGRPPRPRAPPCPEWCAVVRALALTRSPPVARLARAAYSLLSRRGARPASTAYYPLARGVL